MLHTIDFSNAPANVITELNDLTFGVFDENKVYKVEVYEKTYIVSGGVGIDFIYQIIPKNSHTYKYLSDII